MENVFDKKVSAFLLQTNSSIFLLNAVNVNNSDMKIFLSSSVHSYNVNINFDSETIEAAGEIFTALHIVEIIIILLIVTVIVFLIKNLNKIVDARMAIKAKNKSEKLNGIFSRFVNKNKKNEAKTNQPQVDEICNDCVKSSVMAIQKSIDSISETLKTMNLQIERATINAGLAATGGDLALTDWLRIVFDLWRKGVNGNTVSATKIKIMKENGLKTWNSELSYNRHKYKEVNKHFQDCVKKIEDGLR